MPCTLVGGLLLRRVAPVWLVLLAVLGANLFFYGWFKWSYLGLLGASIGLNYLLGVLLIKKRARGLLIFAIALNLGLLGFFKYAWFFASSLSIDAPALADIVLPLAISFYTFQQISFVVDCYRGEIEKPDFVRYALYVSFFPQLIAGPIVRFSELYPQIYDRLFRPSADEFARGLSLFIFGLAKKLLIADQLAVPVNAVWAGLDGAASVSTFDSWLAVFGYSFQIYFDFSAYSDMAIGLGLMMGVTLPVNFLSPYRATSIRDFWRRWHITLSRWLRDYLYIPVGGNRAGPSRHMLAVFVTMGLGGLWHGAGWNFVLWGLLHGVWIWLAHRFGSNQREEKKRGIISVVLTFLGVTALWIFFRGEDGLWIEMFVSLISTESLTARVFDSVEIGIVVLAALIAFLLPANVRVFGIAEPASALRFRPNAAFALCTAALFVLCVVFVIEEAPNAFIYFQF